MARFDVSPEQASRGRVFADADLPMLAAEWLADGYDSPLLRELAGLSRADATEARRMFGAVLAELGHPIVQIDTAWDEIQWAIDQLDRTHSPYAAAQRVLNVLGDVPDLWQTGRGDALQELLDAWLRRPHERDRLDDELRAHIRSLSERDVPLLSVGTTRPDRNVHVRVWRESPDDRAGLRGSSRDDGELTGSDQDRSGQ